MKYMLLFFLFIGVISDTVNEKKVWDFLKLKGLTNAGAAGLMGNLYCESRIESVIYEEKYHKTIGLTNEEYVAKVNSGEYTNFVKDKVGFGLAQWTYYSRKQALLNKCLGNIGDMDCQLEYLYDELKHDFSQVLNFLETSNDIYSCTVQVMAKFEKPSDQSDKAKNYRNSISQKYYNTFVKNFSYIWNYLISSNFSQYGTAALMGNFYVESEMESGTYDINFHKTIGLTNDEYVNNVNNGIYKNFENDNAGFGIVQWSTSSSKQKLLNKCKGKIGDLICQLNFLREDLSKNYEFLDEILKTCIDLKNCTTQFYLIYNNNLKNKENEKLDLIYLYAKEYNKTLSKKCNSNQFFGFRNKKCNNFPIIPNNCRFTLLDTFKNNSYNISCFDPYQYRCNQSFYSEIVESEGYTITQQCIPLSQGEFIHGCAYYNRWINNNGYYSDSGVTCAACDKEHYLSIYGCIDVPIKISHCKMYTYIEDFICEECEFGYHLKKNNCYKIPSKIENCYLYEDFYNYEFSCLKTEKDEIENKENSAKYIFYNHLYQLFLYLLL